MIKCLLFLALLFAPLYAQGEGPSPSTIVTGVQSGLLANRPTSCLIGQVYYATDQPANNNVFFCQTANNWVLQSGANILGIPASAIIYDGETLDVYLANLSPGGGSSIYLIVGSGSYTNIATTVAACPNVSTGTLCYVAIPSTYTGGDSVLGYNSNYLLSDSSPYAANVQITDYRKNPNYSFGNCYYVHSNQCSTFVNQGVYGVAQSYQFNNVLQSLSKWTLTNGGYFQTGATSNYQQNTDVYYSRTEGQNIMNAQSLIGYSPSDKLIFSHFVGGPGGVGYPSFAEGDELWDATVAGYGGADPTQGAQEPIFSISSNGTGLNTVTITSFSQGAGQLGQRYVVDTAGGAANTVTGFSNCTADFLSAPCIATLGTPVTVTPVYATISSGITGTGSQVVTPSSYTLGTGASWSVGMLACVFTPSDEPECAKITAVNGTSTFTATFNLHHAANALVAGGGLAGSLLELNADRVTSSTYPEITLSGYAVTGTLHLSAWPIIACTTSTTCVVAVQGKGYWRGISYGDKWTVSNNAATVWNAAKMTQAGSGPGSDASNTGGPVTFADNTLVFNSSHTYEQFYASGYQTSVGNLNFVALKNNFVGASGGFGLAFDGIWANSDCLFCLANNTNINWYTLNGGNYISPYGIKITGQLQYGLSDNYGGQYADLSFGCPSSGCADYHIGYIGSDAAGRDALEIMGQNNYFALTYSNQSNGYYFRPQGLEQPCLASNTASSHNTSNYIGWVRCSDWSAWANDSTGASHEISGGGGTSLPWTTLGDTVYYTGSAAARLAGPTTNGPYLLTETPVSSVAVAPVWLAATPLSVCSTLTTTSTPACWNGTGVGAYAYVDSTTCTGSACNVPASDVYGLLWITGGSANITMPQAATGSNYPNGSWIKGKNAGSGTSTFGSTTSTFCVSGGTCSATATISSGVSFTLLVSGGNYYVF